MTQLTVRRYTFPFKKTTNSFDRRATKFQNNIVSTLRRLGITQDDIDCEVERVAMRKAPAIVTWYFADHRLYYSYNGQNTHADNLYVASKVLEGAVDALVSEEITLEEFLTSFTEDTEVEEQRIEARKLLGVAEDSRDLAAINKQYKLLAKSAHPDMDGGSHERFSELNQAHKLLKRELE